MCDGKHPTQHSVEAEVLHPTDRTNQCKLGSATMDRRAGAVQGARGKDAGGANVR